MFDENYTIFILFSTYVIIFNTQRIHNIMEHSHELPLSVTSRYHAGRTKARTDGDVNVGTQPQNQHYVLNSPRTKYRR